MCFGAETLAAIGTAAAVAGTATSLYGASQQASAQKRNAAAIGQQNLETRQAQQKAFDNRILAQQQQGKATFDATMAGMADRAQAATQMRTAQQQALDQQKGVLTAENTQAERLRAAGDQQAQLLLEATSGQQLAAGQQSAQDRQNALLASQVSQSDIPSPDATNPYGSDQGAYKRRLAEAATNIRDYGSKIAATGSYAQPGADVGLAIAGNKQGIMPAAAADQLLRGGSNIRLLPSQVAYQGASNLGGALDQLIQGRTQGQVDTAKLIGGNDMTLASLGQADTTTQAANKAAQAKADADYAKSVGGVMSGLGNLGLYGTGYKFGDTFGIGPKTPLPPVDAASFASMTSGIA